VHDLTALLGLAVLGLVWPAPAAAAMVAVSAVALIAAVLAGVHHAEVVALRVGEPFGTLVLALAITVIEVALILALMLAGSATAATIARDTLFATVMIVCNGVIGLCVVAGTWRGRVLRFRVDAAGPALAALVALGSLVLVLPLFTTSSPEGTYTDSQLAFTGLASLALWSVYVFVQTVRHRDYFLPEQDPDNPERHAPPPGGAATARSAVLLMVSLVAVVGLAKSLSPSLERLLAAVQAPKAAVGLLIAAIVLLPETLAAVRAALAGRLQTSLNLALGSALASIGLTVPCVVLASVWLDLPLVLGLGDTALAMLATTFVASAITLSSGRMHLMAGAVHLVMFAAFVFLAFVP
jgi:Ca2+:H+ antiporter